MSGTERGAERPCLFELKIEKSPGPCVIALGSVELGHTIVLEEAFTGVVAIPVTSSEDIAREGAVRVGEPHKVVAVRSVASFTSQGWSSKHARPIEDLDVIAAQSIPSVRLADGWAPRELVQGKPVRWVSSAADIEVDPVGDHSQVCLKGIIGPSLGRGASVALMSGEKQIAQVSLDLEDGQPFDAKFDVRGALGTGRLRFVINRPQPRFTHLDSRTLNLLIKELVIT